MKQHMMNTDYQLLGVGPKVVRKSTITSKINSKNGTQSSLRPKSASIRSIMHTLKQNRTLPICRYFGDGSANFQNNIKTLKEDLVTKFLGSKLQKNVMPANPIKMEVQKITARGQAPYHGEIIVHAPIDQNTTADLIERQQTSLMTSQHSQSTTGEKYLNVINLNKRLIANKSRTELQDKIEEVDTNLMTQQSSLAPTANQAEREARQNAPEVSAQNQESQTGLILNL